VSSVTGMDEMFLDSPLFNSNISKWDVSGVTIMSRMFLRTVLFNSDI
jgi:surface protein